MNEKTKKATGIITNVIVIVLLVFVTIITLNIILSRDKGYTSLFGRAYVSVQSDSMEGGETDSFRKGDLIKIRILSDAEKNELKTGDVITFYQNIEGYRVLNTHRIIAVSDLGTGKLYTTQGDKAAALGAESEVELVAAGTVVGKYTGKRVAGLGKTADFFRSSAGFFVCVVLPSLLVVAYFAVQLIFAVKAARIERATENNEDEREKLRQELLRELHTKEDPAQESSADDPPRQE